MTERTLTVSRFIDAPLATVWTVMSARMDEWFCPAPWRAETVALERRPGGRWAMKMLGPDGEDIRTEGLILAWDEERRIVSTDSVDHEFNPRTPFMVGSWEVEAEGSGTRYTASARHWSDEDMEKHRAMGFEPGWSACADQIARLSEEAAKSAA